MAVGDWHALDGGRYVFRETLHGPFVAARCVDCGGECYAVQQTGRINAHGLPEDTGSTVRPRCSACGRRKWGAPVKLYADRPRVQHGAGNPGAVARTAEVVSSSRVAIRRGLVEEWPLDDPRVPTGARGFIEDLARAGVRPARVCHTVAFDGVGKAVECVGVHWRGGSAFWNKHVAATGKNAGKVTWTGEVYAPMRMTVTQAILALRERMGT